VETQFLYSPADNVRTGTPFEFKEPVVHVEYVLPVIKDENHVRREVQHGREGHPVGEEEDLRRAHGL
jgi:hypothetical protein